METRPQSVAASAKSARTVPPPETGTRGMDPSSAHFGPGPRKPAGYGLPCAKCHLYYPADLDICPICSTKERVSPIVPTAPPKLAQSDTETTPDAEVIEQ